MANFRITGIVSHRDKMPSVELSNEKGMIAQLSMSETRQIAMVMLQMAARCEMDAIVLQFFEKLDLPPQDCGALLQFFRDFRAKMDADQAQRSPDPERVSNG
jgi:hypothetical protein